MRRLRRGRKSLGKIEWEGAEDISKKLSILCQKVDLGYIDASKIKCVRSQNANTRAYARIWGLSRIWQMALNTSPHYVIEVISEKFDKLKSQDQDKILLHEIAHIPKNFSGALLPHTRRGKGSFYSKLRAMEKEYESSSNTR